MKKLIGLLIAHFIFLSMAYAQSKTVTGTVKDEAGTGVPFATITEKGTENAISASEDGSFSISVAGDSAVLEFSSTGYEITEQTIGATETVNIVLKKSDSETIPEVIVTAYGTQKKEEIAGAVSTLKAEEIAKTQTGNVMQSLNGKVGGVQIRSTTGQPGASPSVRFRGIGSISSSNQPLYVVDGVPYNGDVAAIAPQDIDQISFLKDASANALYGSRGANGVVIITTKKGKGQMDITYDGRVGYNSRAVKDYDIIKDPKEYYELRWQRLRLGAMVGDPDLTPAQAGAMASEELAGDLGYNIFNVANDQIVDPTTGKINPNAQLLYHDDWDKAMFDNNIRHEHFVSIRYGTDKLSSYLSGGYLRDEGYVINSGFDRVSARANLEFKPYEFLEIGGNANFGATKARDPQTGKSSGTFSNLFSWTRNLAPIYPIYARNQNGDFIFDDKGERRYDWGNGETINPDGTPTYRTYIANMNPYATTIKDIQTNENKNLSLRGYVSLDFLKNFNFRYNLGYDYLGSYRVRYSTPEGGDAFPTGGSILNASNFEGTITNQQLLTYDKNFDKHNLNLMIGHESSNFTAKMLSGTKQSVVIPDGTWISNASKYNDLNGYGDNYNVEGYLSKLNYNYDNKYFLNASFRRDGSSVFHPDNRWGNFYGIGGAWLVSKEDFLSNQKAVTNLKLKISYGEQGNDNLFYPTYVNMAHRSHFGFDRNFLPYVTQYEVTPDAIGNSVISPVYLGNKDLRWEVSKNFNTGFELSLFDRVNMEVEYFSRGVSDMLYNFPLSPSGGIPSISRNIGNMRNRGVEILMDGDVVRAQDFNLNLWVNATHYKNIITQLPDPFVAGVFRFVEGKSSYTYYTREFAGVDPETGQGKWYMGEKDEISGVATGPKEETTTHSEGTQYLTDKTAHPDVYGGFGLNANYKRLSVALGFAYQFGGYIYDQVYLSLFNEGAGFGVSGANFHKDVYQTWTPENKNAPMPILSSIDQTQYAGSDLFLIKANYLSLENISVSYSLAGDFISKLGLRDVRLSVLGNNLFMKSKRQGLDPRMMQLGGDANNGTTLNNYSLLKTLSFGLTVKF